MPAPRVAISQPYFILGGRLSLVLGIVKTLNAMGIEPDILALGYSFTPEQIMNKYGHELRANFLTVKSPLPWIWLPQDYQIIGFNRMLKKYAGDYDLLINSSNSQLGLPSYTQVMSYIHFPREHRIQNGTAVEYAGKPFSMMAIFFKLSNSLLRLLYRRSMVQSDHSIVCNSQFSKECFLSVFPDYRKEIPVIYPPVKLDEYKTPNVMERRGVISLGRFATTKKQLEQIKIAELLPAVDFHIVGFVTDHAYFKRCRDYVVSHGLKNVHLHPNLDYNEMVNLLTSSKYFLHTLVNEPFGITAVEAIAAGCIPIVHNSGGQKETVPLQELRYDTLQEIPEVLKRLEIKSQQEVHDIIFALQTHAQKNFHETVFLQRMSALLKDLLSSNLQSPGKPG